MATQYTPILQLALPVTGELNGTWGDVVNDNITSMVEQAIAGLATINTWTTNSHTLTTADGTTDEARCAMLVAQTGAGGTALTGAGEIICPARTKLFVLQNGSAYAVTLKTSAGTGIAVAAGDTAFLFCDGTNVNACVTQIVNGHITGNLTVDGNTTLGNTTSDTITATARIASDINPSADNTYDLGTSGNSWRNLYIDGTATIASLVATTADINGGTVDNATIGATTASTGRFTQVNITGQGDLRLEDTTGGEYVALQAPGTLSASYTLTLPVDDGTNGQALITDGSGNLSWSTAASGDVYGPSSATDNAVARFDLTTGKIIQNSVMTIADDGASVLSVNSASDGLRITQTGTGNALVVEDSVNPDSTPFVVNSTGAVGIGTSSPLSILNIASDTQPTILYQSASGGATSAYWRSNGTIASPTAVVANDVTGVLQFRGYDGSGYRVSAQLAAEVDGTPGTNDMPGRLVFSTTRDGASSPTEAMRITNAGQFGINGAPSSGNYQFQLGGTIISAGTASYGFVADTTIPSASTSSANLFYTSLKTQAVAFTLGTATHFSAAQGTLGAGSAITNQYGFIANNTLTGATNNYGFYSNIAAGTGRYNFYAAGSADNYFAGSVGIGLAPYAGVNLYVTKSVTGNTSSYEQINAGTVQSDVTAYAGMFESYPSTVASAFTLGQLTHFGAGQSTIGAGSTVTNQYGFFAKNTLTGATNNFGFYSDIASATNRFNFYAAGTADNYFAGKVGVGAVPIAGSKFSVAGNSTEPSQTGILNYQSILSTNNTSWNGFATFPSTQATAFTLATLRHFSAGQGTIGAGSAVTTQFGFNVDGSLTGATNNYGFYSGIAAGTGRWNFYAAGTANNYFAGNLQLGNAAATVTPVGTPPLQVTTGANIIRFSSSFASSLDLGRSKSDTTGTNSSLSDGDGIATINFCGADGTSYVNAAQVRAFVDGTPGTNDMPGRLVFATSADGSSVPTERMRIDSSGNLVHTAPTTPPTLATNGTMVFNLTSNTNLRVSVRGSDGVTRVANITLA